MREKEYFCRAEKCCWRHDAPKGTRAFCVLPTCPRGLRYYRLNSASIRAVEKPRKPESRPYTTDDVKEIIERRDAGETVDVIASNMDRPAASVLLIMSWYDKGKSYKRIKEGVFDLERADSE